MKKIFIFLLLIVFTLTLSSCINDSGDKNQLIIGFASTLTGDFASVGNNELYGAQMAVEEINEAGGIFGMEVVLEIKDDRADPEIAVQINQEFLDDGIDIIIGHGISIVALDVVENIKDSNVIMLSPSIGTEDLSNIDDSFIRNVPTTNYEGQEITNSIIANDPSKVLLIYNLDNIVLTQYHLSSFESIMISNGYNETDFDSYGFNSNSEPDLNHIMTLIDSDDYDTIFLASSNIDAAPIVNYILTSQKEIDIHLSTWASTGINDHIGTGSYDNLYGYSSYREKINDEDFISFKDKYESKYGIDVHMLAVNTYDLVYMLKEAIEYADSTKPSDIKTAILEISTFEGISGGFSINEYGDCIKDLHKMVYINGKFEYITQ